MSLVMDINLLKAAFNSVYEGPLNGTWYESVAGPIVDQPVNVGTYPGLDSVAGLSTYTGTRQKANPSLFKMTLTNVEYEASLEIPLPDWKADYLKLYQGSMADMAEKARYHWNGLIATLLANGHSNDCQDGKKFFATDHTQPSSGTQSNLVTFSTLTQLDVVDKNNPTAVEMANIIVAAVAYMQSLKDAAGSTINGQMRKVIIATGNIQKLVAIQSAISQLVLPGAVTNPTVGLTATGFSFEAVFDASLAGDSIYFVRGDGQIRPFILQQNGPLDIQTVDANSDLGKYNLAVFFGIYGLRAAGYGRYQSALKATLHTHS